MCVTRCSALIVVYNKSLDEISTLDTILVEDYDRIYVWNNGPSKLDDSALDQKISIYNSNTNRKLGSVYNVVMSWNKSDYLLILDDDSRLPQNFVRKMLSKVVDADVILPKCVSPQNVTISPVKLFKSSEILNAVMSGIMVKNNFELKFNENLEFYGVDKDFVFRVQEGRYGLIYKSEVVINHDVSFNKSMPVSEMIWRNSSLLESNINLFKLVKRKSQKIEVIYSILKNVTRLIFLKMK